MNKYILSTIIVFISTLTFAQDELLNLAESNTAEDEKEPVSAFFTSRLAIGQSVETHRKNQLVLHVTHRFDALNTGAYNLWGLDAANIRIGFDYGITDKFNVAFGRTRISKTYDLFGKYKILQQQSSGMPITLTAFIATAAITEPKKEDAANYGLNTITLSDRLSYTTQLLIARNFADRVSFQLMPTYVHKNNLNLYNNASLLANNGTFALGLGSSIFITNMFAVNLEYYLRTGVVDTNPYNDAFSIGFDLETGGHIFQIQLSNSFQAGERAIITETADDFWNGDIHLGFNITRTFQF